MKVRFHCSALILVAALLFANGVHAQTKSGDESIIKELRGLPDGVLKVKANPDGSFKSLIVKATVEIEDALGGEKGKRMARNEAEIQCRKELSQWLQQNCSIAETSDKIVTIVTIAAEAKDSAGMKVNLKAKVAEEIKQSTETYRARSEACVRGLLVLATDVTTAKPPEFILVMGLSQKSLAEVALTKDALSGNPKHDVPSVVQPAVSERIPAPAGSPGPETKVAPDAKDFM